MNRRALSLSVVSAVLAIPSAMSCSSPATDDSGTGGAPSNGGAPPTGTGGTVSTGGALVTGGSASNGGSASTGGSSSTGGTSVTGGSSSSGGATGNTGGSAGTSTNGGTSTGGSGGATKGGAGGAAKGGASGGAQGGASGGGSAGKAGSGGASGAGGQGVAGGFVGGGAAGMPAVPPLDCGAKGTALESHGPPMNRLNYVIAGDGYTEAQLQPDGTMDQHLKAMLAKRFSDPIGQPFLRYRNFVNICVLRIPSTAICGSSVFGCCGNDSSRLANCNTTSVNNAIRDNIPASFEIDWRSVMLNGSSWWNSGGALMMFSGGNADAGGAALHEGGHGHNQLADEYGNCEQGRVSSEAAYGVNVSLQNGMSGGKWEGWIGYNQTPGTGMQGFFGCDGGGTWRSSSNSMMNSLFGNNPNTSFNAVSREKIIMDIWRAVQTPYDSLTPPAGAVMNPTSLTVNVIDPAVISVDWTLDGALIARNGGPTYNIGAAKLAAGSHTVTARAYDNAGTDLVRQVPGTTFYRQYWGSGPMGHSDKTVTWTVTIP